MKIVQGRLVSISSDSDLPTKQNQVLNDMRNRYILTDCEIVFGESEHSGYHCHLCVISSASPFIYRQLKHLLKDGQVQPTKYLLKIPKDDMDIVDQLINFIYTGCAKVKPFQTKKLLKICLALQCVSIAEIRRLTDEIDCESKLYDDLCDLDTDEMDSEIATLQNLLKVYVKDETLKGNKQPSQNTIHAISIKQPEETSNTGEYSGSQEFADESRDTFREEKFDEESYIEESHQDEDEHDDSTFMQDEDDEESDTQDGVTVKIEGGDSENAKKARKYQQKGGVRKQRTSKISDICNRCGIKLEKPDPAALTRHKRESCKENLKVIWEEGKKHYGCPICPKAVGSPYKLSFHIKTVHYNDKLYRCEKCDKSFAYLESLKNHNLSAHENISLPCPECDRVFNTYDALNRHRRFIHRDNGIRKHVCDECGLAFREGTHLRNHKRFHDPVWQRELQCEVCQKLFTQANDLRRHMMIHTGDKPFQCDLCAYRSNRLYNLNLHMKSHAEQVTPGGDNKKYKKTIGGKPTPVSVQRVHQSKVGDNTAAHEVVDLNQSEEFELQEAVGEEADYVQYQVIYTDPSGVQYAYEKAPAKQTEHEQHVAIIMDTNAQQAAGTGAEAQNIAWSTEGGTNFVTSDYTVMSLPKVEQQTTNQTAVKLPPALHITPEPDATGAYRIIQGPSGSQQQSHVVTQRPQAVETQTTATKASVHILVKDDRGAARFIRKSIQAAQDKYIGVRMAASREQHYRNDTCEEEEEEEVKELMEEGVVMEQIG